jgi:Tfp pilus assembly protein PilV
MLVRFEQADKRTAANAFTLAEVLVAFFIFGLVTAGMIYGYVQANRMAEWSSQSLAGMSYAAQGMERMRSAQWAAEEGGTPTNGPNTYDVMPLTIITNPPLSSYLPSTLTPATGVYCYSTTGAPINVTNFLLVTQIHTNPTVRQIVSQVVWTFGLTGKTYTNAIVTLRAPDQFQ